MIALPITCSCGKKRYHYGACDCPDGQLWEIDQQRQHHKRELKKLDAREREVLGLVPIADEE